MLPSVETIPRREDESFGVNRFACEAFPFLWHVHPEHELTLIVAGRGQRFVGGSIEPFVPGEVVLLASNVPHTWRGEPGESEGAAEGGCASVVVQFLDDALGRGFFDLPEMSAVRALLSEAQHGLVFNDPAVTLAVARLGERQTAMRVPALLEVLLLLTQSVGRRLCERPAHRGMREGDGRRIDVACRLLNERYLEEVSLDEVAAVVHLTPSATCRLFRRVMGRTVVSYLHELRVGHACRMLAEPGPAITEVCFASGFGNVANFNRVFRRLRGVSPGVFRRGLRGG